MTPRAATLAASLTLLVACAGNANDPAAVADRLTRAVYANDSDGVAAMFDDAAKKTVTRAEVGMLSDTMHALGDFRSLSSKSSNADTGRYEFDATFSNGTMLVQLRLDPSGKVGAYRVTPHG